MRAKIMPVSVLLLLLLLLATDSMTKEEEEETGSRSTGTAGGAVVIGLGNASARERDFRRAASSTSSSWLSKATSVYRLADVDGDDLIGGHVTSFAPDVFIWKSEKRWQSLMVGKGKTTRNGKLPGGQVSRAKRSEKPWIEGDYGGSDSFLKMHAFVVRDEDISGCGATAAKVTKTRYFMCSGVILNKNHVLTSASCVNRAEIDEYHIDADLAVLIGALEENSYVIKIARFEIHPRYVLDPNSIHHAKNNVAVLTLSCSIPRASLIIPKLPSYKFSDVGHVCCPDRCKLLTVIENSQNRHIVRVMKIKHLPAPVHRKYDLDGGNDEKSKMGSFPISPKKNSLSKINFRKKRQPTIGLNNRTVRNPEKAPFPEYFTKEMADRIENEKLNENSTIESASCNTTTQLEDTEIQFNASQIETLDWKMISKELFADNITKETRSKIVNFTESLILTQIMTPLMENMTQWITTSDYSFLKDPLKDSIHLSNEEINSKVAYLIRKILISLALKMKILSMAQKIDKQNCTLNQENSMPKLHDKNVKTSENEPETDYTIEENVYCPPLGSPIVAGDTLIALIAYTCDDVQSWVAWKYVNINHNIQWIRMKLKSNLTGSSD